MKPLRPARLAPELRRAAARVGLENAALALLERLLFDRRHPRRPPKSVLVYRTGRLGDFLNAVPALAVLRRQLPEARIGLLTTTSTDRLMERVTDTYREETHTLPWVRFVVPSVADQCHVFTLSGGRAALAGIRRFLAELKPEAAFLLPFSSEGALARAKKLVLLRGCGLRCQVYGIRARSTLMCAREAQWRAGWFQHQVLGPLRAIAEWPPASTVPSEPVAFPLTLDAASEAWAAERWARSSLSAAFVIAVFPGAAFPHKMWPLSYYVKLCRALAVRWDVRFVLLGLDSDRPLTSELCSQLGTCPLNLAGQTSLGQLAAVLTRCQMFVGNDGGAAHLASALGCPCVTIMSGIEYLGLWEPWGSREASLRHEVGCSPCFAFTGCPRGTRECLTGLSPERVLAKCEELIATRAKRLGPSRPWPARSEAEPARAAQFAL